MKEYKEYKEFEEFKELAFGRWSESLTSTRSYLLVIHSELSPRRALNSLNSLNAS
jgi:hypothetical protein